MPVSTPKQRCDIDIIAVDAPEHFDRHKKAVERIIANLSEAERAIIGGKRHTRVEISDKLPEGNMAAYWDEKTDTVRLSTTTPNLFHPEFMKPLLYDFKYLAAHELHHPLIHEIGHHAGRYDPAFTRARKRAQSLIHKDRTIGRKVDEVVGGMHKTTTYGAPPEFLGIDYGWKKLDTSSNEQLGVMLGVLLSDEYHEAYSYTSNPYTRFHDARYEEILCNVKALAHVFGEERVRAFAGDLLDYVEKRNPHRGKPGDMPEGRKSRTASHRIRSHDPGGVAI